METWGHIGIEAWRYGDMNLLERGTLSAAKACLGAPCLFVRGYRSMKTWRHRDMETRKNRNMET
jgi:hypothetical protein